MDEQKTPIIVGDDGELLEADPEADPRDYELYIDAAWEAIADVVEPTRQRSWSLPEILALIALPVCCILFAVFSNISGNARIAAEASYHLTPVRSSILSLPIPGEFSLSPKQRWGDIQSVQWSPDNRQIGILTEAHKLYIWDFYTGKLVTQQPLTASLLDWSPNGVTFAISDAGKVDLRDGRSGGHLRSLFLPNQWDGQAGLSVLKFSPDGKQVIVAYADSMWILEASTGIIQSTTHFPGIVHDALWALDSQTLFVVVGHKLYRWNAGQFEEIPIAAATWLSADLSPDGSQLIVAYNYLGNPALARLDILDSRTGQSIAFEFLDSPDTMLPTT